MVTRQVIPGENLPEVDDESSKKRVALDPPKTGGVQRYKYEHLGEVYEGFIEYIPGANATNGKNYIVIEEKGNNESVWVEYDMPANTDESKKKAVIGWCALKLINKKIS